MAVGLVATSTRIASVGRRWQGSRGRPGVRRSTAVVSARHRAGRYHRDYAHGRRRSNLLAADPDNLCGQRGDALRHAPTVAACAAYEHDNVFLSLGRDWWAERAIEGDLRWSPEMVAALEDEWAEARDPGGRADPLGCPRGTRVAGPSPPTTGGGTGARRAMGAIVDGRKDDTGGDAV